jgi:hypothetical protein
MMASVQALARLTSAGAGLVQRLPRTLWLNVVARIGQVPKAFPKSTTPWITVSVLCPSS